MLIGSVHHQCFAEQCAVLGTADVECIRQGGQIRQCQVIVRRGEGGAEAGTVHEQEQAVLVAAAAQRFQFSLGVDGADFRSIGDVHQTGQNHMFTAVAIDHGFHQFGCQLAVRCVSGADLMTGGFDGAGFVNVDVTGVGGNDRLIGAQQRVDDYQISLRAAYQKMDIGVRCIAHAADGVTGGFAKRVHTIADGLG